MTEEQSKMLEEVHEILTFFKGVYDTQLAGKEFSPNPNDTKLCPKSLK